MNKRFLGLVELAIGLAFLVGAAAIALGEEFYKGKTIRIVVGFPPGGGYDTYTRAVVRHMSRYLLAHGRLPRTIGTLELRTFINIGSRLDSISQPL